MPIPAVLVTFLRRRRRLLGFLGGLYGLWLLVGFLLLPLLLRPRIERAVQASLHRPARLAQVRFNPLTFGLTLRGLRVAAREGGDWITLDRLYLNLEPWRLLGRRIVLSAVEVEGLWVRVILDRQGRLNFQDLLEGGSGPEAAPAPRGSWGLEVGRLQLRAGRLAFQDHSASAPFQTVLGPIAFRVDGLRTDLGHRSAMALEAWTEARERLAWKGDLSFEPFASRGRLEIENLDLSKYHPYSRGQVASEFRSGTATLEADYRLEWGGGRRVLALTGFAFALKDVKVAEAGGGEPAVELPAFTLKGGRADLLAPSVEVDAIEASGGRLRVQRDRDGGLNLVRMLTPPHARPADPGARPLQLQLREARLRGFRVDWADALPVRPVALSLADLDLSLRDFTLEPGHTCQADLSLKLGEGTLAAAGTLQPLRGRGDLKVKLAGLALAPLDPYLEGPLDLRLASGMLGAEGRLRLAFEGKPGDGASFQGGATLTAFEARDGARNEPFLRWKRLAVAQADLRTAPLALKVGAVDWTDPEARLVVDGDGSTNVARALKLPEGPVPVTAAVVPPTPSAAPEVTLERVAIRGGRLSLVDRSVKPQAALLLSDLEGSYLGLSSRPEAASRVDFRGKAGGLAPVTITGHAMPLRHDLDTDVALRIQGADLTDFTPYTGKYLGYAVQKGKLEVAARLRIQQRKLAAENAVKLDQFYLGEKVESPEATGLPVKLGLALLRDRKGVIAFDLPVEGSLDDPDVKYGKLVWKAVFNLLGKLAASPFTLLGKLFGGEAGDLSQVAFAPGGAGLDAAATARLQGLARALAERPELRLEAEGAVDEAQDGVALRQAALEARLARIRAQALKLPEPVPVPPAERERWLRAAFEAAHPAPKAEPGTAPPPPPPAAEVEQRLRAEQALDPEALAALADARAKAVLAWLLGDGKADPGRVFQVRTGQARGATVAFSLK